VSRDLQESMETAKRWVEGWSNRSPVQTIAGDRSITAGIFPGNMPEKAEGDASPVRRLQCGLSEILELSSHGT
jgi:hypothetical protein